MSYEVRPDGTIIAPDEASAIRLSRRLLSETKLHPPSIAQATRTSRPGAKEKVQALLDTLVKSGAAGIGSSALAERLGIEDAKGLAPYLTALKKRIMASGQEKPEKLFWRKRTPTGTQWYADAEKLKHIAV